MIRHVFEIVNANIADVLLFSLERKFPNREMHLFFHSKRDMDCKRAQVMIESSFSTENRHCSRVKKMQMNVGKIISSITKTSSSRRASKQKIEIKDKLRDR